MALSRHPARSAIWSLLERSGQVRASAFAICDATDPKRTSARWLHNINSSPTIAITPIFRFWIASGFSDAIAGKKKSNRTSKRLGYRALDPGGATLNPRMPALSIERCTNPDALASSMNSLI